MKKFDITKTLQLIIFIALTGFGLYTILTDSELYRMVAVNPHVRTLCILLWLAFGLSFLFIFLDFSYFSSFKKEFRELDYVVHSDHVSGIANRYSCDTLIEKYLDKPLPQNIGCIMFDLTNIKEINELYGHLQGNHLIRDFSSILQTASQNLCFVGRNGGNKFLALFEDCSQEKMDRFLRLVAAHTEQHNAGAGASPIAYAYGTAFQEDSSITMITELIALSNRRIYEKNTDHS